jgi:sortase A
MARKRRLSTYLIIGGILLMIIPLSGNLITRYQQEQMLRQYEETLRNQASQLNASFEEATGEEMPDTTDSAVLPGKPAEKPEQAIGKILIPAIDSELLVVEGTDSRQLRWGAGHLTGSAYPGESGNCVLAAHRDYTFGTYFSRLDEVNEGDIIEVEYLGFTHSYRVIGSMVTTPDDLSVLMPTENPMLTLITCHPRGSGKERLIVTAEPM